MAADLAPVVAQPVNLTARPVPVSAEAVTMTAVAIAGDSRMTRAGIEQVLGCGAGLRGDRGGVGLALEAGGRGCGGGPQGRGAGTRGGRARLPAPGARGLND